jgi:regulator of sirC expression with transglutaminase-like and TPR domain
MQNEREINALIQLLDDIDQEVFSHVHDKLTAYGTSVIPLLEQAWGEGLNPVIHERLEEIIHQIQYASLVNEWGGWLQNEKPDLLTGALLIAKYHFPDMNFDEVHKKISKIKQTIWLELNYQQTALEQIQIFNQIFYSYHNFKGTQISNEYQDYCINHIIENKRGSAIGIGVLYQILAADLNLPVYGVPLTRHYVLAFCKKNILDFGIEENLERDVMFYINPINRGSVFSRNEIKDYLGKLNEEQRSEYFIPASNVALIKELLKYLIEIYRQQNRTERIEDINALLALM